MQAAPGSRTGTAGERPAGAPTAHPIARGEGWAANEYVCRLGPEDPGFEERHERFAISLVMAGSFRYRTAGGSALLYPGAFMLGNAGACYECGHDHTRGDRCIAFHYDPHLFHEIAASTAGSSRFRFSAAMLPPLRALAAPFVEVEAGAGRADPLAAEELALRLAENVLAVAAGSSAAPRAAAARDLQRIGAVLQYVETHPGQAFNLAALAGMAFMSKYHFLRTFRGITGMTPYQYLLAARLRSAALQLRRSSAPIAVVAFEAGFGDLSSFNASFRSTFGSSPSAFRAASAARRAIAI